MFVDKLKKIKTRIIFRGEMPCTKESWRYIGVNGVYRCLRSVINNKCVVIACRDDAQSRVTCEKKEIQVDNPLICWISETAHANNLPVYCKRPGKKSEWRDALIISSHLYHMKRGHAFLYYRSPLEVWRKMDRPILTGETGQCYDAVASAEICSGYSRHSMAYAWAYLVLGPVGLELERQYLICLSKGKTPVLLGEEEHIFVQYMNARGYQLAVFPWGDRMRENDVEACDSYLKRLRKRAKDTVLVCSGAYPDEKSEIEHRVDSLTLYAIPEYIEEVSEHLYSRQWDCINSLPYRMDHIEKEEMIYSYNESWDPQKRQLLLRAMLDFAEAWGDVEQQNGKTLVFQQKDMQKIFSFGNRYLARIEQEGEEI